MAPVVTRPEWGAPPYSPNPIGQVGQVFIHHSVTNPHSPLVATMQQLEAHARALGHQAIDYSFCHFVTGERGEGRGWFAAGGHTINNNSTSYGLCGIGNFVHDEITPALLDAFAATILEGIYLGAIAPNPAIRPHSDVFATACPGALREAIPEIAARVANPGPSPAPPKPTRSSTNMVVYIKPDKQPYRPRGGRKTATFGGAHVLIDGSNGGKGSILNTPDERTWAEERFGVYPTAFDRGGFKRRFGFLPEHVDARK